MARPQNKEEFRRIMAEEFANVLEKEGTSWRQQWAGGMAGPRNGVTDGRYRGTNAFWLSLVAMNQGFTDPRWVTSIQVNDVHHRYHPGQHWHIKAGSKATHIEYWYPFDQVEKRAFTWQEYRDAIDQGRSENEFSMQVRYTPVFNANQIEGMPELALSEKNPNIEMDELVKKLFDEMGVAFKTNYEGKAYYTPAEDTIYLPPQETFTDEYAFNSTALHELIHATGHMTRLNRPLTAFFGSDGYAYEELIAEISACFMGADLNAAPTEEQIENHESYVKSWAQGIREKPDILVKAIRDAQQASTYMEMKAGLLPEQEYDRIQNNTKTIKVRNVAARGAR